MPKRSTMLALPVMIVLLTAVSLLLLNRMMTREEPPKPGARGVFLYMYEFPNRPVARNFTSYVSKIKDSGFNIVR
ncbi:MAG: hypothetical protein FGF51_00265 [Candidatus Brockarchaeota archaeon]|nr:hypothetical protein [Candidatus Brockarchaeota archaeon]